MSDNIPLINSIEELANNFDHMLEALSALQQLGELRTDNTSEIELVTSALGILHRCCRATTCTAVLLQPSVIAATTYTVSEVIAIDSSGAVHMRAATPVEMLFLADTMNSGTMQHCHDCSTLGNDCPHSQFEKTITAVPLFKSNKLVGALSIGHSTIMTTSHCDSNLLKIFASFLGHMLNCRSLQQQLQTFRQR